MPTPAAHDLIERIYGPVEDAGRRELARWSPAEITLITEFLRRGRDMQLNEAGRIRDLDRHRGRDRRFGSNRTRPTTPEACHGSP